MRYVIILVLLVVNLNCQLTKENPIVGLWLIAEVRAGEEVMTPLGKWSKFNSDFTQESGNGWYKHSYGEWSINSSETQLLIDNKNGFKDEYGAFKISIADNSMTWERMEDGNMVIVKLKKIENLPESDRDKIIGIWKPIEFNSKNAVTEDVNLKEKYLYLRWDRKFMLGVNKEKKFGVYNIHGHKPEIELIPYEANCERAFWKFNFENDELHMELLNSEDKIVKKYKRVNEFPQ